MRDDSLRGSKPYKLERATALKILIDLQEHGIAL